MPDSDEQLVALSLAGDLRAFERLVQRYRDVVYRVAARIAGEETADDVTQDTFLRAFHRLGRYRGEGPFRAWLLQIAHRSALSQAARAPAAVAASLVEVEQEPAGGPTPAEQVEAGERRRRLDVKLKGLAPHHRTVLVLRDVEGLSYHEICQVTAMPMGSVKARLHRARGELIDVLRRNTYDWDLPDGH